MNGFDVFNGDADGLCALQQLRLAQPREATLVSGTKRDIALLQRVPCVAGALVTVLDVSLERNRDALLRLLACGMQVDYFDHHFAGDIPVHAGLRAHIDTAADLCTSALVDRHLCAAHRAWAVVGAFGDNLDQLALGLAASIDLGGAKIEALRELGRCLNYNAYGDSEFDLIIAPAALYQRMRPFSDPLQFLDAEPALQTILQGQREDRAKAELVAPQILSPGACLVLLPDAAWSRRVRGDWGNTLAQARPERAHAVLTPDGSGSYVVSVRAPLNRLVDADRLCRRFPTGGGRAAAAGIDRLEQDKLADFVRAFEQTYMHAVLK